MKNKIWKYFSTEIYYRIPFMFKRGIIEKQAHNQNKSTFFVRNIVTKH